MIHRPLVVADVITPTDIEVLSIVIIVMVATIVTYTSSQGSKQGIMQRSRRLTGCLLRTERRARVSYHMLLCTSASRKTSLLVRMYRLAMRPLPPPAFRMIFQFLQPLSTANPCRLQAFLPSCCVGGSLAGQRRISGAGGGVLGVRTSAPRLTRLPFRESIAQETDEASWRKLA